MKTAYYVDEYVLKSISGKSSMVFTVRDDGDVTIAVYSEYDKPYNIRYPVEKARDVWNDMVASGKWEPKR